MQRPQKIELSLGYWTLCALPVIKMVYSAENNLDDWDSFLSENNPDGWDSFRIRFSEKIEPFPAALKSVHNIIAERNFASSMFYRKTGQVKKGSEFVSYIFEEGHEKFPADLLKSLFKVAQNDPEVSKICSRAADTLVYEEITKPIERDELVKSSLMK